LHRLEQPPMIGENPAARFAILSIDTQKQVFETAVFRFHHDSSCGMS
jgi:hypothetical protein